MDEIILWEVNTDKLKRKQLYVAANRKNFKKLFKTLNTTHMLYYYDWESGRAEFCDVYETTRVSLICDRHNINRIGRVHELYIDSDCEIHSSLALYVPLCNLPGAKPFEVIDIPEYRIYQVSPLFGARLLTEDEDEDDPSIGIF